MWHDLVVRQMPLLDRILRNVLVYLAEEVRRLQEQLVRR